jgi:hypothetical protein
MEGLIDYAGLFPPARLELDAAIPEYVQFRKESDAWMLGRFIIPVAKLTELDAYDALFAEGEPFCFSVLGHPALQMDVFEAAQATVAGAREFEIRNEGRVVADRFEIKLQPHYLDLAAMADLFAQYNDAFAEKLSAPTRAFFEVPLMGERWEAGVEKTVRAIADANSDANPDAGADVFGLKLRCGGVTADAFPDIEAIAFAILMCRDADVPFKATAGLHHPVRHYAESVEATMHGFLNVFGGAIFARLHSFDSSTLERMIGDEHTEHFGFSDDGFAWMDWRASPTDIAKARTHFATTFGSCSFDEPREDLQALGMLDTASARV